MDSAKLICQLEVGSDVLVEPHLVGVGDEVLGPQGLADAGVQRGEDQFSRLAREQFG